MNRMKNWFRSLGSKAQMFMYGRYGLDELSQFLSAAALLSLIIGLFAAHSFFGSLAVVLYLISAFRIYSKNTAARRKERDFYIQKTQPLRNWTAFQMRRFADRKTHKLYKCPQCKASLRVPKGKGKIKIHCPQCGGEIIKKT